MEAQASARNANPVCLKIFDAPPSSQTMGRLLIKIEINPTSTFDQQLKKGAGWGDLPGDVIERIVSLLPANAIVCTFRLISKATAALCRAQRATRLSQLVPHHAFIWRWGRPPEELHLTLAQRRQLLCLTARSGCLANLQVAFAAAACSLVSEIFDAAADAGHMDVCEWLADKKCPFCLEAIKAAAKAGHLDLVRWLMRKASSFLLSGKLAAAAWEAAASSGQRALCEGLLVDGLPVYKSAAFVAAHFGHADLTEWLLPQLRLSPECEAELLCAAAHGFSLAALRTLHDSRLGNRGNGNGYHDSVFVRALSMALHSPTPDWAAKVQWLQTKGVRPNPRIIAWRELLARGDAVARLEELRQTCPLRPLGTEFEQCVSHFASLGALTYLRGYGLRSVLDCALVRASEQGDLELLRGLLDLGCAVSDEAVLAAAKAGKLAVLRWLAEADEARQAGGEEALRRAMTGCWLMRAAALSGSLELVAWLREWGCPWNEFAFWSAAESGSTELIQWMHGQGCPMGADGEAYLRAGRNGDFATLCCLRRLGCPWDGRTLSSAVHDVWVEGSEGCGVRVLRWLVVRGCPVSWMDWQEAKARAMQRTDAEAAAVLAWVRRRAAGEGVDDEEEEEEDELGEYLRAQQREPQQREGKETEEGTEGGGKEGEGEAEEGDGQAAGGRGGSPHGASSGLLSPPATGSVVLPADIRPSMSLSQRVAAQGTGAGAFRGPAGAGVFRGPAGMHRVLRYE
ncbi:hypothetical protein PLESTM_002008500 [Pleodorina starrii]|nr:hypothetical protein PLESTM_002008500 [Pleodorina starrii]